MMRKENRRITLERLFISRNEFIKLLGYDARVTNLRSVDTDLIDSKDVLIEVEKFK